MQLFQPDFMVDGIRNFMARQKQRKQLILGDSKNIFAHGSQPIQLLQPDFIADGIKNFMARQKQRKQLILGDSKNIFT